MIGMCRHRAAKKRRCRGGSSGSTLLGAEDWRDFRASLVQRERLEQGLYTVAKQEEVNGWAHATPLIERGSILLSMPGSYFAMDQQYFHKAVILIIKHGNGGGPTGSGDVGVILNRPTAFRSGDLHLPWTDSLPDRLLKLFGMDGHADTWNIWFGGDCQGIYSPSSEGEPFCTCLHTEERLAAISEQVIRGVFIIGLPQARALVSVGLAHKNDFLVIVGYCGWAPGQLQTEVNRADCWTLAAANQQALLGELRIKQAMHDARIQAACARQATGPNLHPPIFVSDVGDGFDEWERLHAAVHPMAETISVEESHVDKVFYRWAERCLICPPMAASKDSANATMPTVQVFPVLCAGMVLRASPTAWLLGSPAVQRDRACRPMQYLHKAVLLLLEDCAGDRPSKLALLNGPRVGTLADGAGAVFFGGTAPTAELLQVPGGGVWGQVVLPAGSLESFLRVGALQVVEDVLLHEVLQLPPCKRWTAVGGKLESLADVTTSALADVQRRTWYARFVGLELELGE